MPKITTQKSYSNSAKGPITKIYKYKNSKIIKKKMQNIAYEVVVIS